MKTYFYWLVIFIFGITAQYLRAQSTGDWNTAGNFINSSNFLGSTNNIDLVLRANNVEAYRLNQGTRFTGIGTGWTTTLVPQRTLDVGAATNNPQFRITHTRNSNVLNGIKADFQTSSAGNLHIKPTDNTALRTVAIGFLSADLAAPTTATRLDVAGLTRIREMQVQTPRTLMVGYSTLANLGNPADNFVGRLDFPNDPLLFLSGNGQWLPGGDKDWQTDGTDVWTGDGTNGFPGGKVSVGVDPFQTISKFEVHSTAGTYSVGTIGIRSLVANTGPLNLINFGNWTEVTGGLSANYGEIVYVDGVSTANLGHELNIAGNTPKNIGSRAFVDGANDDFTVSENIGYSAQVGGVEGTFQNIGVYGEVYNAKNNFAIYGKAQASNTGLDWAGFFDGDVFSTTGVYASSDEELKVNVASIENAAEILSALSPKSYDYNPEISDLSLSTSHQYGFMAQDVEEILPELVKNVETAVKTDSLGNILVASRSFKAIRYGDVIPILVAGYQGQQATIAAQTAALAEQAEANAAQAAAIAELESALSTQEAELASIQAQMATILQSVQAMQTKTANCCQENSSGEQGYNSNSVSEGEMKLAQNVPNPFADFTRIDFELPAEAQITLEITDMNGRPIERLVDGMMGAGKHSIQWDGSRLAPGMYFYTLYANGTLLSKKMIKK